MPRQFSYPRLLRILIPLAAFALAAVLARELDARHTFDRNDVLFGDDSAAGVAVFSRGWSPFNLYRHPNVHFFTGHAIRIATELCGLESETIRRQLALLVSPLAGALSLYVLGGTLVRSGIAVPRAVTLTWIAASSFAQQLFSSDPTHFSLSGLAIVLCLWLVARPVRSIPAWMLLGFMATSITTTNLLPWAVAFFWTRAGPTRRRIVMTGTAAAGVCALVLCFNTALSMRLYGEPEFTYVLSQPTVNTDMVRWFHVDLAAPVARLPAAMLHGFLGGIIGIVPEPMTVNARPPMLTFVEFSIFSVAAAGLVVALLWEWWRRRSTVGTGNGDVAAMVVALHAAIFSFYGSRDLFLYASHWHLAIVVLLGVTTCFRPSRAVDWALGGLACGVPLLTALTWMQVFKALE